MRAHLGFLAMAAAFLGSGIGSACFIDRKSSDFECDTTTDCDRGLVCDSGFCVVGETTDDTTDVTDGAPLCPDECSSCDEGDRLCIIECSSGDRCGDVDCPIGWSCQIDCAGPEACGDVRCSDGACDVTCQGPAACGAIRCRDACACDVTCEGNACEDTLCPIVDGENCTADGSTDTPCTSVRPDCNQCN